MNKKKKQKELSLSARQRKELRAAKAVDETKTAQGGDITADGESADAAIEAPYKLGLSKRKFFLVLGAIGLAVILIVMAILIPTTIYPAIRYSRGANPVAIIKLDNGMTLEFEIFEEECPIASANFMYLARKKFFNGTIIHDIQNDFVRIGGYTDWNDYNQMKENADTEFSKSLEIETPNKSTNETKMGYTLKTDSGNYASRTRDEGYLSFMYSSGAGRFQMCAVTGANTNIANNTSQGRGVSFARFFAPETLDNIKELAKMETEYENSTNNFWKRTKDKAIKIKSVTLRNVKNHNSCAVDKTGKTKKITKWTDQDFSYFVNANYTSWSN